MLSSSMFAVALGVLSLPINTFAAPPEAFMPRDSSVCSSGIYGELAPILAGYPIAQAFCSAVFPVKCPAKSKARRGTSESPLPPSTTTLPPTTTTPPTTTKPSTTPSITKTPTAKTTTTNKQASAWSKCQGQGAGVISTMCSCIEGPPKGCTTTTTKSPTTTTTTPRTTTPPTTTTTAETTDPGTTTTD